MRTKFSEGQWEACCLDKIPHFVFAGDKCICGMKYNDRTEPDYTDDEPEVTKAECVANARLIQAVPEMFKFAVYVAYKEGWQYAYDIIEKCLGRKVSLNEIAKIFKELNKVKQ